jgi:hypothetical protein
MRRAAILILMTLAGGCACARHPAGSWRATDRPVHGESPALSLAFAPAIAAAEPPIALWRDDRIPAAFVGYEELSTSFIYIRTDDRQTDDGTGYYVRRAIVEKVGVGYR